MVNLFILFWIFLPVENPLKDYKRSLQGGEYVCTHKQFAYNSGEFVDFFVF